MKYIFLLLISVFACKSYAQRQPINLIDTVLASLDIVRTDCMPNMIVEQNSSATETILVIPEIADNNDGLLIINSHILLVNYTNGKIISRFSEKESWYSDALRLEQITAVYKPYEIRQNIQTIGVLIDYKGSSSVNPYQTKQLSLFVRSKDTLHRVLKDYTIYSFGGETNGRSNGEFTQHKKSIEPDSDSARLFLDLKVIDSITKTRTREGMGDIINTSITIKKLTYKDGRYTYGS